VPPPSSRCGPRHITPPGVLAAWESAPVLWVPSPGHHNFAKHPSRSNGKYAPGFPTATADPSLCPLLGSSSNVSPPQPLTRHPLHRLRFGVAGIHSQHTEFPTRGGLAVDTHRLVGYVSPRCAVLPGLPGVLCGNHMNSRFRQCASLPSRISRE
jgi:hypothetical protein